MCTFTSFCENWDANCRTAFAHEFINFVHLLCFSVFGMQVHKVTVC